MGGSLLASHGIISYVRGTFTSKCSLPCVPHLFKQVLMLIHPLPCQGVKLIQPMEIQRTDPLTRELRNGLLRKPSLTVLPLLLDPSPVLSPSRSSPTTWILPCNHVKRDVLKSASYGRPVGCLVQTRSLLLVQTGSILSQTWRACNLLRSRRMKTSVAI